MPSPPLVTVKTVPIHIAQRMVGKWISILIVRSYRVFRNPLDEVARTRSMGYGRSGIPQLFIVKHRAAAPTIATSETLELYYHNLSSLVTSCFSTNQAVLVSADFVDSLRKIISRKGNSQERTSIEETNYLIASSSVPQLSSLSSKLCSGAALFRTVVQNIMVIVCAADL